MTKLILSILKTLGVRHTAAFVRKMCLNNIQGDNFLGITRLLGVFGVKSSPVRLDDGDDFSSLELPYITTMNKSLTILVTSQDEDGVTYTDGTVTKKTDWASFLEKTDLIAVMLSAEDNASEPGYKDNRRNELYGKCLWAIPALWLTWLLVVQFSPNAGMTSVLPPSSFRITGIVLSAAGLFLSILLHRQWTGDGNAVERVCSHFKTSKCSSAHDTFFFNKWFDLSEIGISYFLAILLIILIFPQKSWSVAWLILPALPASLWNLGYQFFKQKHWCPICVAVQILFWITALAFLLCGAYGSPLTFNLFDFVQAMLLWGTMLVVILKVVTPAVQNRHEADSARLSLSSIKGNKIVLDAIFGKLEKGGSNIEIAVSPTCPYCRTAEKKIEEILMPTGRFVIEKKYKSIHEGDDEKIVKLIGPEEAEKHKIWCQEHNINATPTIFVNGIQLNNLYSVEDLLYL